MHDQETSWSPFAENSGGLSNQVEILADSTDVAGERILAGTSSVYVDGQRRRAKVGYFSPVRVRFAKSARIEISRGKKMSLSFDWRTGRLDAHFRPTPVILVPVCFYISKSETTVT